MEKELKSAFLNMKREDALNWVEKGLASDEDPLRILDICRAAMVQIGEKFESGDFFLSELIYSAQVFKSIGDLLEPHLLAGRDPQDSKGVIVFGTPKGDVHDLGKNIVITMMRSFGFTVHDLGVDVPPGTFLAAIHEFRPDIVGLSCLISSAFKSMRETIGLLQGNVPQDLSPRAYIIGGLVGELMSKDVGADYWTNDAMKGVRLCQKVMTEK